MLSISIAELQLIKVEAPSSLPLTMPDVDKLFEKAEKYLQKQKFEAALETYQEIFKYEPGDEEVLLNLGDSVLKLNRTADALRYQIQSG